MSLYLYPTLCNPMDYSPQAPLSMEFSRQEYWSGFPFPSPGDLPNPGIEPGSHTLQADSLPTQPLGKPLEGVILNPKTISSVEEFQALYGANMINKIFRGEGWLISWHLNNHLL